MKLAMLSNLLTPHQLPLCKAFNDPEKGIDFKFYETLERDKTELPVGWLYSGVLPNYVVPFEKRSSDIIGERILDADAVLIGSAPDALLRKRHRRRQLTIRYSERFYKTKCPAWQIPLRYIRNYLRLGRHKNEYMLCASAYTAGDLALTHTFLGKTYKWGYFPETKRYELDALFSRKRKNTKVTILWAGRFLDWKHPEAAIHTARELKKKQYDFTLTLIGTGQLETQIRKMVHQYDLEDCVFLLGAMTPEQVRGHMEQADIFLFTSDRNEGWGAVLNESMNSGCAVVASHAIGSVPFLINHGENGLIYHDGDQNALNHAVIHLLEDADFREHLGRNAYHSIVNLWNAEVAADRLLQFIQEIQEKGSCDLFEEGPCSRSECIEDTWFDQCLR